MVATCIMIRAAGMPFPATSHLILADVVLNVILSGTKTHIVIPAMIRAEHIRSSVAAMTNSKFDSREIAQIRTMLAD